MKAVKSYNLFLVLVLVTSVIFILALTVPASAKKQAGGVVHEFSKESVTGKVVDRVLERIESQDPNRAKRLRALRKKSPRQFRQRIREHMLQKRRPRQDSDLKGKGIKGSGIKGKGMKGMPGMGDMEMKGGMKSWKVKGVEYGGGRGNEYIVWLEKTDPEKAAKMRKLCEANPKLYHEHVGSAYRRYGRVIEATKENPELAGAMKENIDSKKERDQLIRKIKSATSDDEKSALKAELKEVLGRRHDNIVKRKRIMYETLLKNLKNLEKRVKKNEAELKKYEDAAFKQDNIDKRLEKLLDKIDEFHWD